MKDVKNITLSLDEKLLEAGREYAKEHNMSLNSLVRRLLAQTVLPSSENWLEEFFRLADGLEAYSGGVTWKREDLYDV